MPIALTIAGSDSSGGAGIQADLKTFHQFGVYGTSVITALTAQNTMGISAIHPIPPEFVVEQYVQVMSDIGADAVKTGMLVNAEIVCALAEAFDEYQPPLLVVDPVMTSSAGTPLLDPYAMSALIEQIFPFATLVTPNLDEAADITGSAPIQAREGMAVAAEKIHALGAQAVLIKGGHLPDTEDAVDLLYDGSFTTEFRAPRFNLEYIHGTGCVLSAAITAGLAKQNSLQEAVRFAKDFVTEAIKNKLNWGDGAELLNHFVTYRPEPTSE
ncbi:MAG: bifunctional hydroxymethylpyrimidine kinase/phosphomethylpyrimidine kinase [Candidatus Latescibacteria bacterium]|nr:bifunctional hydroxymethylpyrimidine kinase/phosphomethylpyrimidine kinase [Candidatus Latescibacterota bacterium]